MFCLSGLRGSLSTVDLHESDNRLVIRAIKSKLSTQFTQPGILADCCHEIPWLCLSSGVSLSALGRQVQSLPMSSDTNTALYTHTAIVN